MLDAVDGAERFVAASGGFVTVQPGVRLEVLDWGGSGRPVVLHAGGANTSHDFDQFATKLISDFDSLQLHRPVLVGHSRAGEELSSIGSRHPEKIAGLIYLDAGYYYAYYDPVRGSPGLDILDLQRKLRRLLMGPAMTRREQDSLVRDVLAHDMPMVEKGLRETLANLANVPDTLRRLRSRARSVGCGSLCWPCRLEKNRSLRHDSADCWQLKPQSPAAVEHVELRCGSSSMARRMNTARRVGDSAQIAASMRSRAMGSLGVSR